MNELYISYLSLLLARIAGFVSVIPPLLSRSPRAIRAALALVITLFYLIHHAPRWDNTLFQQPQKVNELIFAVVIAREMLLGIALGFVFNLFLLPARLAGEFLTLQISLNVAPSASPTGVDSAGPLTILFESLAAVIFLGINGHHAMFLALDASFTVYPLGGMNLPDAAVMLQGLSSSYEAGLLLAAPLGLCLMLGSISLAIMSRVGPMINMFSVGFTLQILIALAGMLFLLPDIIEGIHRAVSHSSEHLTRIMER